MLSYAKICTFIPQLGFGYRDSYCILKQQVRCAGLHETLVPWGRLPGLVPSVSKAWFLGLNLGSLSAQNISKCRNCLWRS